MTDGALFNTQEQEQEQKAVETIYTGVDQELQSASIMQEFDKIQHKKNATMMNTFNNQTGEFSSKEERKAANANYAGVYDSELQPQRITQEYNEGQWKNKNQPWAAICAVMHGKDRYIDE
jgi:hypothetical protein